MTTTIPPAPATEPTRAATWTARLCTALSVPFFAFDAVVKLSHHAEARKANAALGFEANTLTPLGLVELACLALYLTPRTAPIGAVLFTGYLGGAIAAHVRADSPLLSHTLFPLFIAALLWLPLYLLDPRVRRLVAARS